MAISELSTVIAKHIVSFDPFALDGMTFAELESSVQDELRSRDGVAYYCNFFDMTGNTVLSDELIKLF